MKKELLPSLIISILLLAVFLGGYTAIVWVVAQIAPNHAEGAIVKDNGKVYYANIAQKFTDDKYFWSRPSAVDYNAAGSGGSNKGPANPEYLATVQQRIDTFMKHNPAIRKSDIPADMVTASGSGLDPDISVQGAIVQIPRIAQARNISVATVQQVVATHIEKPLLGILGPEKINVLQLNIALNNLK